MPVSILRLRLGINARLFFRRTVRIAVRFNWRLFDRRLVGPFTGVPERIFGWLWRTVGMLFRMLLVITVHIHLAKKHSACGPVVGFRSLNQQPSRITAGLAKCVIVNLSDPTHSPK